MAKALLCTTKMLKATIYLFLLAITLKCASSARILDEVDPQQPVVVDAAQPSNPAVTTVPLSTTLPSGQIPAVPQPSNPAATVVPPVTTLPSGQIPTGTPSSTEDEDVADPPLPDDDPATVAAPVAGVASPVSNVAPIATPITVTPPVTTVTPIPSPTTTLPIGPGPVAATSATVAKPGPQLPAGPAPLSFFMHDIIGGTHPSARVVTGIIAKTEINGIPFSKVNSNFFPMNGGTPLLTTNNLNNIINPNNLPFLTGLNGAQPNTILQNTGNNNIVSGGDNQPFVTAGQLPSGTTLQKIMFGTITVIDDELTEGQELGSAVVGRAQGFYLASSLDGTSQTVALTLLLHGSEHEVVEDAISFFGVHRMASLESQIAVVGGTGKYENAKGYATLETLHQQDQHTTDGVDTILHFSVYLSE